MRAGTLRHPISLEQYAEAADGTGDPVRTWSAFATGIWASIEPLSARSALTREVFAAQQVLASATHLVRMRYLAGVTPKMRVKFGTRYFRIVSPPRDVDERTRELELLCEEISGGINE